LRVSGKEGWLHDEAFVTPEQKDEVRALLWDRVKTLARNHGLVRLWIREQAPFWHHSGFGDVAPDRMIQLPKAFGIPDSGWRVLQLRDDPVELVSAEKELAIFQQTSRVGMEQMLAQTQRLRTIAYAIGLTVFIIALGVGGFLVLRWLRQSGAAPVRR
jgi:hypothetical protein